MKRFFFSLIALSAAAVGCTQSAMLETPDFGGTEVSFSPYTGRTPESKATSIENVAGLAANGFNVYCFLNQEGKESRVYLPNELVESADNGLTWSYDNLIYWPTAQGSTLDFVAYSANGVNNGLSGVSENGFTFTVNNNVANQIDLLATAYQAGNTLAGGSSVTLKFHHLLSRVGFKLQASQTIENRKIKITNLALKGNMPKVGTLTFADSKETQLPVLTASTESEDFTTAYTAISSETIFDSNENVQDITLGASGRYMMIMPHSNENDDHYIEVTYAIGTGTDYSSPKTVELDLPSDFTFVAGKAYEFVLQISTSKLSFDIEEQPWDTDDYDNDADKDNNQDFPLQPEEQNAITLGSAYVTTGSTAVIPITVNKQDLYSVEIQCKPSDVETWEEATTISVTGYTVGESKDITNNTFSSNTEYNYRACVKVASSSEEIYYYPTEDSQLTFITYASVAFESDYPKVTDPFTCEFKANYDSNQGNVDIVAAGFCWNLGTATPNAMPKLGNDWNPNEIYQDNNGPIVNGQIAVTTTSLSDAKTYSCRAYVVNAKGIVSYSETKEFKTPLYVPDEDGNDDAGAGGLTPGDEI